MKRFLTTRERMGVWFAPLMAPVLGALGMAMWAWEDGLLTVLQAFLGVGVWALPIGAPIAWLIAVVLGLPVLKLLQRMDRVSFPWIVGSAGCLGMVGPVLLLGIISWLPRPFHIGLMGYLGFMGLGVGWVFWLIAYKDWEGRYPLRRCRDGLQTALSHLRTRKAR